MPPWVAAEYALWVTLSIVCYSYLAYPIAIWCCAHLFGRRQIPATVELRALPQVSLLIAAHNEERWIRQKIENSLTQDYPRDRLEIIIASDGSTDSTTASVQRFSDEVRLVEFHENRGKATVLNESVPLCGGEFIVFSDANTFYDSNAVRNLMRWFVDPTIGAVCGRLVLTDPATGQNVDSLYWKYETFLKKCESRLGALLGANGAIYALRRNDFIPIPADTIVDDFVIPLLVRLRTGKRIIYDCEAFAWEESPPEISDEFRRRSRIGAGGFQSIVRLWPLLLPTRGWIAFTFFSHKLLRWLCPFFLIAALLANLLCLNSRGHTVLLLAQFAFYAIAAFGHLVPGSGIGPKLIRLPAMFTSMNFALLCGFWRWVSGQQRGVWQRTAR
jgi:cellulose synthase/poly-beta-1,6-N-acetylglucosamine synthase-like glycosyltransferase